MGLGYISVTVHPLSEEPINRLVGYAGVKPMAPGKLHATLIYDKSPNLKEPLAVIDSERMFVGTIMHIKEMGKRNEDGSLNAVAIYVASGDLTIEHLRLRQAGYQHGFPEYEPHVSLGYDCSPHDFVNLKTQLETLVGKEIYFYNETLKPTK